MNFALTLSSVSKSHKLSCLSINFWMGRNIVLQLPIKVIISNTLNIKLLFGLVNFNVEWVVCFEHGISLFLMMAECSISSTFLESFQTAYVSNSTLKVMDQSLHQSWPWEKLTGSCWNCLSCFDLPLKLWSLSVSIAIKHLSIFDPKSMDHGISIEPMISVCWWHEFWVWPIPQIYSVYVGWDSTLNYLDDFIRLLFLNWSKVALQDWVLFWINPLLFININLNWFEEQPKRNLVQRVDNWKS